MARNGSKTTSANTAAKPKSKAGAQSASADQVDDSENEVAEAASPVAEPSSIEPVEQLTDKALVVVNKQERQTGWFTRFMISLGLRSGGSLRDDLHEALAGEGEAGDVFSPEERAMLQNILRLRERRVEDVMVPRAEIHAVALDETLGEVLRDFEETGHSRLPVYNDTLDDPRGMVLIKDLLLHITQVATTKKRRKKTDEPPELDFSRVKLNKKLSELDVIRKVLFVPPSMLASDLMARMQATRTQMALVIDEYGGTDGLVSLEDIVEEVVGEIEDEHDEEEDEALVIPSSEGVWSVDARIELEKLAEEIGGPFDPGDHGDDMDTLGGLVFSLAGRVPVRGEVIKGLPGFEFRVLDADPRRIKRIQLVQTHIRDKRRKAAETRAAE